MSHLLILASWRASLRAVLAFALLLLPLSVAYAQGVTTGSVSGIVRDSQQRAVSGAAVTAVHLPSGTVYETVSRADGRFVIPNMRVGGPYAVVVSPTGAGAAFQPLTQENVTVNLGVATDLTFTVQPTVQEQVTVVGATDPVFSSQRTGAATTISREMLSTLPTIGGRLNDMTRLTPQSGGLSFAGTDPRLNNITVDGSVFNNGFGLRNSPGDTSGVAPISLSAIEQVQVSIAPYDVRQGNFVGAAVNTVTRSGGNQVRGSYFYSFRDNGVVGTTARGATVNPGTFEFRNTGGWVSGPIAQNRSFFFFNFEDETLTSPGTTFRANTGTETVGGSVTRVLESHLNTLSEYLQTNFGFRTGGYQGYDFNTPARRYLFKVDHNLNDSNKISMRYNHLDSSTDVLVSNSSSLGIGSRRGDTFGLNYETSNYSILENIRSFVGEWNSIIGTTMANSFIAGWTSQDESRGYKADSLFPFVDIMEAGRVYTSFGFEPFTPNNELRYKTFQAQNNLSYFTTRHALTFGASAEVYRSENVFFPGSQSAYVYNSLADFYTDANDYLANPNRTTSPVTLRRFDLRWSNIPGQDKPIQPLEVFYMGAYMQDDWAFRSNVKFNLGLRFDVPFFGDTGFRNANADALTFRDEFGNPAQYDTAKLPDANVLWSPRFGFNWDVNGDQRTQVRGGTGVFTGRPAYVWISNQVGNTGVLTGSERVDNTTARPWNPNPDHYKPANVTGAPATSYNLELINSDFKFPQVWRTNVAVDHKLPFGWVGTLEYIYNRDVNGIYYINANLPAAQTAYSGADMRPRWTSNRINNVAGNQVTSAVVLKNQNDGRSWNLAGTLERRYRAGVWVKTAYSYGEAKNTVDPGSIATGSFTSNQHSGDPNNPGIGFSANSPGHRYFMAVAYNKEFFRFGATNIAIYWESRTIGNASYVFATDANGDGGGTNDLVYVPRDQSEMNFQQHTTGGVTYTPAMQAAAWDAYISQDPYLSTRRGQYAERNALFLPMVHRADFSISQDVNVNAGGRRHTFQFRVDIDNFTNMLNSDWGVGQRLITNTVLTNPSVDGQGRLQYRLALVGGQMISKSFERTAGLADVYRVMFSMRYMF